MPTNIISLIALAALVPAAVGLLLGLPWGRLDRPGPFWGALCLAGAGLGARLWVLLTGPWPTGLSASLWVSVGGTFVIFVVLALRSATVRRLAPLALLYLFLASLLALVWEHAPERPVLAPGSDWLPLHIAASVTTYALVTLAALAALAASIQEAALKARRPTPFTRRLPAVAECEATTVSLLAVGETLLALGVVTGMALSYLETGALLTFDHKTILILAAFVLIGAILFAHARWGIRGKSVARSVMSAYLLITLGYPGVKFVTDVLLTGG